MVLVRMRCGTLIVKKVQIEQWTQGDGRPSIFRIFPYLNDQKKNSQMIRHLISDAHEWINEIPTVFIYYLLEQLAGKDDPFELDSNLAV